MLVMSLQIFASTACTVDCIVRLMSSTQTDGLPDQTFFFGMLFGHMSSLCNLSTLPTLGRPASILKQVRPRLKAAEMANSSSCYTFLQQPLHPWHITFAVGALSYNTLVLCHHRPPLDHEAVQVNLLVLSLLAVLCKACAGVLKYCILKY